MGVKQDLEGNPEKLISYASLGNWVSLDAGFLQSFKFELQVVFGFGDCHGRNDGFGLLFVCIESRYLKFWGRCLFCRDIFVCMGVCVRLGGGCMFLC